MSLSGVRRLVNYGFFPVVAAAAFQLVAIYRAHTDLGQFFVAQSVIAIGTSIICLQPRTWQRKHRTISRIRWSFVFTLSWLAACGVVLAVNPPELFGVLSVFVLKKVCDAAREFFFLSEVSLSLIALLSVTILEATGITFLFFGLAGWAFTAYATAAAALIGCVIMVTRSEGWGYPGWAFYAVFSAGAVTLCNMGSRFFMVATPAAAAHILIGALLQAMNFMSPLSFALHSKHRPCVLRIVGMGAVAVMIFFGTVVLLLVGRAPLTNLWLVGIYSVLLSVNTALMIDFLNSRASRHRRFLIALMSVWVIVASFGAKIDVIAWETGLAIFLLVSVSILLVCHSFLEGAGKGNESDL